MSEMWKKWEGQVVDHKYQLLQYLGSTDHSVVFLAEFHAPELRRAAIKFLSADVPHKEQQLAAWTAAAQLSHPNLIRILGTGQCRMEELDLLYVAMEYAEENLAQVLPHRALMAQEASEMLKSVTDVLLYLHGKGLVHGHIKPSNVLAMGELLKLSSDTIFPIGEVPEMRRERSVYDAPELPSSPFMPAADIWSLGVTLVEAFTQQPAVLPFNESADPVIPPAVRDPFLEIARNALRRDPKLRWTSTQIAEFLSPTSASARTAAATASSNATPSASAKVVAASPASVAVAAPTTTPAPPTLSPLDVPLSEEPAVPLGRLPRGPVARTVPARPATGEKGAPARQTVLLPNYVIPLFAAVLVVIALILLPFVLRHRVSPPASTVASSEAASAMREPAAQPSTTPSGAEPSAKLPPAKSTADSPAQVAATPKSAVPNPEPAALHSTETKPAATAKTSSFSPSKGAVLDQPIPQVPEKALATISGTVRVGVKVHVDAAGSVTTASLDSAGPSKYFADYALKAAEQWVFTPPEAEGRSVPSDWLIQFHFTKAGVQATSQQVTP